MKETSLYLAKNDQNSQYKSIVINCIFLKTALDLSQNVSNCDFNKMILIVAIDITIYLLMENTTYNQY